jgi:ABC-type multidrug transport system fused ATPase/permease subunit
MHSFFKLLELFTPKERRILIPVALTIVFSSLLELLSVLSVGPFMAVAIDPAVIHNQYILSNFYDFFDFQNNHVFVVFLCFSVVFLVVLSTSFTIGTSYINARYTANRRAALGTRLLRKYLFQPYSYFLNKNTSSISRNIIVMVDEVISGVLTPGLNIAVNGVKSVLLLVLLIVINPALTVVAVVLYGVLYSVIYRFMQSRLAYYGKDIYDADTIRHKTVAEAFGGIKDVKILGKEHFFLDVYASAVKRNTRAQASKQILLSIPSQAMQALTICIAILIVMVFSFVQGSFIDNMPELIVYAFGIMRIVPGFQGIFQNIGYMRFYKHTVDVLYCDMKKLPDDYILFKNKDKIQIPFIESIKIEDIFFYYPGSSRPVLSGVSLQIPKNNTVGLVGSTGCGKTTLVDILMGLLLPNKGIIYADNTKVIFPVNPDNPDETFCPAAGWQNKFGYVPQQIYLCDDSVAANIAFGIPVGERDFAAIEKASRIANIHDFILSELPEKYDTKIGEKGIRLSGGQRQRIGIARALYHNPEILVMDEATSALDSLTENAVMDAIHNLMHSKTIIIIAHRISTVRKCDFICLMEKGRIDAMGTYEEMLRTNVLFRTLAAKSGQKRSEV